MLEIIWQSLWIILPAYISNGSAVIVGGGMPIDFNKKWRGKPIFGKGKTWRGFFGGAFIGIFAGMLINFFIPFHKNFLYSFILISSISFGALIGDLIKSFIKRRIGKKRGEKWILADQLDFLLGALFFLYLASIVLKPYIHENWFNAHVTIWHIIFLLILTPLLHLATNGIAYLLHYKNVPW